MALTKIGVATAQKQHVYYFINLLNFLFFLFSEAKKLPIKEINLEKVLKDLEMDMHQFVDMCILLGCDYAPPIRGIGPRKAFELIQKHKSIEDILENIDTKVSFGR